MSLIPSCHHSLFAERALLPDGWAKNVLVSIDAEGRIAAVEAEAADAPQEAERVAGPLVPALANLHSHAFQRAMAGLAERSGSGEDSFWTWRETMYGMVARMTPPDVEAVAAKLYVDMLKTGYGAVAEFHYLHHGPGGTPYDDPAEMARAILSAAANVGIGLTLLPVFYAHSNFGGIAPNPGQARFIHGVDAYLKLAHALEQPCAAQGARLGLTFHSLRAATPQEMRDILVATPADRPVHLHIAEQRREVEDSIAWSGRRPIEWLLAEMPVDQRWCLIHATHANEAEIAGMAASGAVVGLCPTTEANLGDGIFPGTAFQALGGRFGVGSDSHVSVSASEELRVLEYGQRLRDERRTRLAGGPGRSVGRALFDAALSGGAQALAQDIGAIRVGAAASFAALDGRDPFIATVDGDTILDRWIFARGDGVVRDVMVAGKWVIREGRHERDETIDRDFAAAMTRLAS